MVERAVRLVYEYEAAMEESSPVLAEAIGGSKVWKAPVVGVFKVHSDTVLFGDGKLGLGRVVRDDLGEVMLATCALQEGGGEVDIAEALAARHFMKIVFEAGLRNLVLESDCLKLISHLNTSLQENK